MSDDMMETQSDSIDIASIKSAALRAFQVSLNPTGSVPRRLMALSSLHTATEGCGF